MCDKILIKLDNLAKQCNEDPENILDIVKDLSSFESYELWEYVRSNEEKFENIGTHCQAMSNDTTTVYYIFSKVTNLYSVVTFL